jgi:uncharacterized protein YjaZ
VLAVTGLLLYTIGNMGQPRIKKTILNSAECFTADKIEIINDAFAIAVRRCRKLLQTLPTMDIVFYNDPSSVISKIGIGGNTDNENVIRIPLDASFDFNQQDLMLTICHEIHHAARMSKLGKTSSLFEKIVSEGLADQFEYEIEPSREIITFRKDIGANEIKNGIRELLRIEQTGDDYDYYEWFFGYGEYPKWFGYTVGNYIISNSCKGNGVIPSQLVNKPAGDFLLFISQSIKQQ